MITLDSFKTGLAKAQQLTTSQSLGDRTAYIGASDIGQCIRKAILSKTLQKPCNLKTLLYFARGHLAEEIVATALSGLNPQRQMELAADMPYCPSCRWWGPHAPVNHTTHCADCGNPLQLLPLKAHLDFVFDDDLVLECKSSSLTDIQISWEIQLQTQLFLYRHCFEKDAQGKILVIDLGQGDIKITEPYKLDSQMVPNIVQRGIEIWEGIDAATLSAEPEDLAFKTEPGPLCGCCAYLDSCPAFQGEELPDDLVEFFSEYLEIIQIEKDAKVKKDILRDQALAILSPGKYIADKFRISLSERSRTSTDMPAINTLLEELGQGDISQFQKQSIHKVLDVKKAA